MAWMTDEKLFGTWNGGGEEGPNAITEAGTVLVKSNERVYLSKKDGDGWKPMGRFVAYCDVAIGERMVLPTLEKDGVKDLDTSPVVSATVDGSDITVQTRSGTIYQLVVARDAKELPEQSRVEHVLAKIGERLMKLFRR